MADHPLIHTLLNVYYVSSFMLETRDRAINQPEDRWFLPSMNLECGGETVTATYG